MKVKSIMAKISNPVYTKKELSKLRPGQFVFLKWNDAPVSCVMLLERIDIKEKGDISLYYMESDGALSRHAVHTQIVFVIDERVEFPAPDDFDFAEEMEKWLKAQPDQNPKEWPYVPSEPAFVPPTPTYLVKKSGKKSK